MYSRHLRLSQILSKRDTTSIRAWEESRVYLKICEQTHRLEPLLNPCPARKLISLYRTSQIPMPKLQRTSRAQYYLSSIAYTKRSRIKQRSLPVVPRRAPKRSKSLVTQRKSILSSSASGQLASKVLAVKLALATTHMSSSAVSTIASTSKYSKRTIADKTLLVFRIISCSSKPTLLKSYSKPWHLSTNLLEVKLKRIRPCMQTY